ncbi:MAG: GtrA family protein, partial [Chloroflexota bacterium]|nr:GtrA family protein [Chloroflexota bacterium]
MLSTETWPRPAVRIWTVAQRFQKFLVVGAVGLGVNQGMLVVLHDFAGLGLLMASPLAIVVSMIVTFMLNEVWTWHDRGSGRILTRALPYALINTGGLVINTGLLSALVDQSGMHYFVANLI